MAKKKSLYVAIMAGGGGTRFWPWSREQRPKQILPIVSPRSMIRETVDHLGPLVSPEQICIVTSRTQAPALRRQVPEISARNFLAEPVGRNTAPCLVRAALHIQKSNPDAVMIALPADHSIRDSRGFLRTLKLAVKFASRQEVLITLGMEPTKPETGYGYIQKGEMIGRIHQTPVFKARAFREKPGRRQAMSYLRRGDFLWNSGMFVWKTGVFLAAAEKFLPRVYEAMSALQEVRGRVRAPKRWERIYARCPSVSVDYGIMEKAKNVALIEAGFHWDDVGSWAALWDIWPRDESGNACFRKKGAGGGNILLLDSTGCVIRAEEKLIALIGVKDLVVAEAGNAFLVCPRERSQEVRRVLEELKHKGWRQYL